MLSDSCSKFRRPESILLVIYTQQGQTLLLKRHSRHTFWQSVTGSIRWSGESAIEAAARELEEETGISAQPGAIQDWQRRFRFVIPKAVRHRYQPGVSMNVEHLFSLRLPDQVPICLQPDEHDAYQWIDILKAGNIVWSWTNREAFKIIQDSNSDALQ